MLNHFDFVWLRTPVISIDNAVNNNEILPEIFNIGLYLSSSSLWQALKKGETSKKKKEKIEQSLMKYRLRSAVRCTPYASFAGCTTASVTSENTRLILNSTKHKIKARLDMEYLSNIITAIKREANIIEQIDFVTNNTIYDLPDSYRYIYTTHSNSSSTFALRKFHNTSYIQEIIKTAGTKANLRQLRTLLIDITNVSLKEANDFLLEMIREQILIPDIEPNITGTSSLERLIKRLNSVRGEERLVSKLKEIDSMLSTPNIEIQDFENIKGVFSDLGYNISEVKNYFHADLFLGINKPQLNQNLVKGIVSQVEDILYLSRLDEDIDLLQFKRKFLNKYDSQAIPLNIALDPEIGIGYSDGQSELSETGEIIRGIFSPTINSTSSKIDHINDLVCKKYEEYVYNKECAITLTDDDIAQIKEITGNYSFPSSQFIIGTLFAQNGELSESNFLFDLAYIHGPSAANAIARFAYGDSEIFNSVKTVLDKEEQEFPNAIYAEIVHLPTDKPRAGNIIFRPILRKFEIPYMGTSGHDYQYQILTSDITVQIVNDEIILRSISKDKRIIPRLTTAHNVNKASLPLYKFLYDLQHQGYARPVLWDWGGLASFRHLPRVMYKNIIIRKEKWEIRKSDALDHIDLIKQIESIDNVRKKFNIPDRVLLVEMDMSLLIDFNNFDCLKIIHEHLKRHSVAKFEEFVLTSRNEAVVYDENNKPFLNQIIIPVYSDNRVSKNDVFRNIETHNIRRNFSPNSEWLYIKIYCGEKTQDTILREVLWKFINQSENKQIVEKFFFIRYRDELPHLRVRFLQKNESLLSLIKTTFLNALEPYIHSGLVHKIMIDTYSRELERYHPHLIEEAETMFTNDSLLALRLLNTINFSNLETEKLLMALKAIDKFLSDYGFTLVQKRDFASKVSDEFLNEFAHEKKLSKRLDSKYREFKAIIFDVMFDKQPGKYKELIKKSIQEINERSVQDMESIKKIISTIGHDKIYFENIIASYIHMFVNRIFTFQQRKFETITYYFLAKYYTSIAVIYDKNT